MTMNVKLKLLTASIAIAVAPLAVAQTTPPPTTPTPPPTTTEPVLSVPANRLVNLFTNFLGSRQNAISLVTALRNGTDATLVTKPACVAPCTTPPPTTPPTTGTTIPVETKP